MKPLKHITFLIIALAICFGSIRVAAQNQSKTQSAVLAAPVQTLDFSAYVNGQMLHLDFESAIATNYTVELYNLTGTKIGVWKIEKSSDKYCEVSIDQPLRKGLYIIKVSAGQQVVAKKVQT